MYEKKQRGARRWYVVHTDLATDTRTESPEMKAWEECGRWIENHARGLGGP